MANAAFRGTPKQERELRKFIKKHKDQPGAMMPVLQEAQGIYGYLPSLCTPRVVCVKQQRKLHYYRLLEKRRTYLLNR